jgi:membrane-associated phospholipid phosphatase
MTTAQLAELVATHLWLTLFIITSVMVVFAWGCWYGLQRWGGRIVASSQEWLRRIRVHARRWPTPLVVSNAWQIARRLGIQALLSAAFAVIASVFFLEIADEMGADEDLGRFDIALSAALSQHASDVQLRTFAIITHLGDKAFLMPLVAIVAVLLLRHRRRFIAAAWVVACALGGLLNLALKAIFERSRPEYLHTFAAAEGWSFPSGHSSGAIIVYGLLGYLAVLHTPRSIHVPAAAVAMTLVVCVGLSRVILQVHYFSDVLAGYAFGASWVAAWIAGIEVLRRAERYNLRGTANQVATSA